MKTRPIRSVQDASETTQADRRAAKAGNKAATAYDAGLVQRFKAGDEAVFTEIVQRHYSRIRSLANHVLRNQADAEEVAQDTFIRAHRGLANFRGDSSLAAWLYCIALNLSRNRYWFYFRRRRHDMISIDKVMGEGNTLSLAGAVAPRSESMTSEFIALIAECMKRLDASHREILTMRTMLNLSYDEIAASLGINVGTVKSRIARARECLRELLRQMAPEFGRESSPTDFFEIDRPLCTPSLVMA